MPPISPGSLAAQAIAACPTAALTATRDKATIAFFNLCQPRAWGRIFSILSLLAMVTGFAGAAAAQTCPPTGGTGNFAGQQLTNTNFYVCPTGSLRAANFSNADLRGAVFTGQDLTGANFTSANLGPSPEGNPTDLSATILNATNFTEATLTGVDFTFATITCVNFSSTSTLAAAWLGPAPTFASGPNCQTTVANANLAGIDLSGANLATANLNQAVLIGARLDNANLTGATLVGVNLSQASLQNANLTSAALSAPGEQAIVTGADFTKAILNSAKLNQVNFQNATLTGAQFNGVTFQGTNFGGVTMPLANFQGATLQGIDFGNANLENANFTDATFKPDNNNDNRPVNFSCAQLGGVNLSSTTFTNVPGGRYVVNFTGAVMPQASNGCCTPAGSSATYCGTIPQVAGGLYGPITPPSLTASTSVLCPNGTTTSCIGSSGNWSIPNWRNAACLSGQRPLWTPPPCGNPPATNYVQFHDSNLKACILQQLPTPEPEVPISVANAITQVNCPGMGIADLTGLENFWSLERLDLSGNNLINFSITSNQPNIPPPNPPQSFPLLYSLKLANNQLKSVDLTNVPNITYLDLSNNALTVVDAPMTAPNLYSLDLSFNQLTTFNLPAQTNLVIANLSNNRLTDVLLGGSLMPGTNNTYVLSSLDVSHNNLTTLGQFPVFGTCSGCSSNGMVELYLGCNPSFQCSGLPAGAPASSCGVCPPVGGPPSQAQEPGHILKGHPFSPNPNSTLRSPRPLQP